MKNDKDTIQVMKEVDQLMKSKGLTRKPGRPKGSKNKTHITLTDKDLADLQKMTRKEKAELERLKNLIARQDDLIAQLQDELKEEQRKTGKLGQEVEDLEDDIDSWKEIVKTIMEVV